MSRNQDRTTEKLSDDALSKQLGRYQELSVLGTIAGLVGAVGGTISYFVVNDAATRAILMAVLFFGGIGGAIFVAGGAQKKIKELMQSQLGDFFRAELESAFGPELEATELPIDEGLVKTMKLAENQWEECQVEEFHSGVHRGLRFSAANVRLDHVYERSVPREGLETCREMVFRGLILRCETRTSAPTFRTDMPQFTETLHELERRMNGKISGAYWSGTCFSLALETDYEFAAVDTKIDLRNLDAVRESYRRSLRNMAEILDLLRNNPAIFAGAAETEGQL